MERLTKRLHDGKVVTDCDSCEQKKDKQCTFSECRASLIKRPAAYEDIAEPCGGLDRLRKLAEADKDGRVAVLPCKVYETDGVRVYEHTVREVIYETAGGPAFDKNAIGKRIFLTRDEAERALREMEGKKDG